MNSILEVDLSWQGGGHLVAGGGGSGRGRQPWSSTHQGPRPLGTWTYSRQRGGDNVCSRDRPHTSSSCPSPMAVSPKALPLSPSTRPPPKTGTGNLHPHPEPARVTHPLSGKEGDRTAK